jgi:hypothetical protein
MASLLSVVKTSTVLYFSQRFGICKDNSPPLKNMAFIYPFVFVLVLDLAVFWGAFSLFCWAYFVDLHISYFIIGNCFLSALPTGIYQYLQVNRPAEVNIFVIVTLIFSRIGPT